jgi:hypothetical protein
MAEAITVLGLASNIITFIDFGAKVVAATKAVRKSVHGTTPQIDELRNIVHHVRARNASILKSEMADATPSRNESRILEMAAECENLASQMQGLIEGLGTESGKPLSKWESFGAGWYQYRKRDEIEEMKQRLVSLEGRLRADLNEICQRFVPFYFQTFVPVSS